MKHEKNKLIIVGIIVLVLFAPIGAMKQSLFSDILNFFIGPTLVKQLPQLSDSWGIQEEITNRGYDVYLKEEPDFDYSDTDVYNKAMEIKASSSTPEDAVKTTIQFVYDTIGYSSQITANYCYSETASSVLKEKKGDCVSMSRLVTALLRAQGIPARTMGGCISFKTRCKQVYSVLPGIDAKVTDIVEGDYKKRGYLHEYVYFYLPSQQNNGNGGWQLIEATAGQIYDVSCGAYTNFGWDTNSQDRCVILDTSFINSCKQA